MKKIIVAVAAIIAGTVSTVSFASVEHNKVSDDVKEVCSAFDTSESYQIGYDSKHRNFIVPRVNDGKLDYGFYGTKSFEDGCHSLAKDVGYSDKTYITVSAELKKHKAELAELNAAFPKIKSDFEKAKKDSQNSYVKPEWDRVSVRVLAKLSKGKYEVVINNIRYLMLDYKDRFTSSGWTSQNIILTDKTVQVDMKDGFTKEFSIIRIATDHDIKKYNDELQKTNHKELFAVYEDLSSKYRNADTRIKYLTRQIRIDEGRIRGMGR